MIRADVIIGFINGMSFLHSKNIAHRDLKPENILLDDNFSVKITDFGLSGSNNPKDGTAGYIAPEGLNDTIGVFTIEQQI